jgi:hypothetical protein
MIPKRLIRLIVRQPIRLHEVQRSRRARRLQDLRDIRVCTGGIAHFLVGTVAVVRPEAVDRPTVCGACDGIRIPKLYLLEETAGGLVAAGVVWGWAGVA